MIICKDDFYAYTGATAAEAYDNYLNAENDTNSLSPHELEWYNASEMTLTMTLAAKPKAVATKQAPKK